MITRDKLVIFDGNALVHRAFHALPPLTTKSGQMVNAVYGFTTILFRVLKELKPKYVVITFDLPAPTFRHQAFKEYKAQRIKKPQELYDQIPIIKEVVRAFNLPIYEQAGYEADDVIGTVSKIIYDEYPTLETMIVTGDLDTLQLVNDRTFVYTPKKGLGETVIYNEAQVYERYGLKPNQLIDYKALRGDVSDNIPGVPGIGEKTGQELIKNFGSIAGIYQALAKKDEKLHLISPKIQELLKTYTSEAELALKLVTIVRDVKLDFKLEDCELKQFDENKILKIFHDLEFKSLLAKVPELEKTLGLKSTLVLDRELTDTTTTKPVVVKNKVPQNYQLIDTEELLSGLIKYLSGIKELAVDTETSSLDPYTADLVGVSLCASVGEAYFVPVKLLSSKAGKKLIEILENKSIIKVGHNLKFDRAVLNHAGINLQPISFDTMIASYLLRAGSERTLTLDSLVFQEFGYRMQPIEDLIGAKVKEQISMDKVEISKVAWYAAEDADFTYRLFLKLKSEIVEQKLNKLFNEIEMPLVPILGEMEKAGVKVDVEYLAQMNGELSVILKKLEKKIHKLAGREFNINSPKQLKEILFDELQISTEGLRSTKTGVSTAASELEKMRGLHPIIEELFEWRELSKLQSTYVEALPKLVSESTGRVHTSYNQTVAATGRLSSSDPNLQNIPIKGEWGKRVRQAFVAESGFVLLSADYSQIELRIVAHLAGDAKMIEVFKAGRDIHTSTAAFIFDVKPTDVTSDQRRSAKEVNFGVLYGMGAWGLAERTGLSRTEAQDFIKRYFQTFSGVASWIENIKLQARERGYVETLFGRKRALPEINSSIVQVRNGAERMAINLPVQGTAADMLKVAMIRVADKLSSQAPRVRMLLQVHDELVFEVPKADLQMLGKIIKMEMEQAVELSVPVKVEVKVGENWGEMEEIEL